LLIGVYATNIRSGGGLHHLVELVRGWLPLLDGDEVLVWGSAEVAKALDAFRNPAVRVAPLAGSSLNRIWPAFAEWWPTGVKSCDVLFVPGGTFLRRHSRVVYMSQNMLPFTHSERSRYGHGASRIRLEVLRFLQLRTLARSAGAIFLTEVAKNAIASQIARLPIHTSVIPHGLAPGQFSEPKTQLSGKNPGRPYHLLYVSTVAEYKHQWNVVRAVSRLRSEGWPLKLKLVGAAEPGALRKLNAAISACDPTGVCIEYTALLPFEHVTDAYRNADMFVFASSCENLPNILIEAMAAGLPIACSNRQPMPAILGDAGEFFDPEDEASISSALTRLLGDPGRRMSMAAKAFEMSQQYSWSACANSTLQFLRRVGGASAA